VLQSVKSSKRARKQAGLSGIFAADVQVFRFYPDGTLLDVLIKPAPGPSQGEVIERWLRPESPPRGVHTTSYKLDGRRVSFTTRGHLKDEKITALGTWVKGVLTLDLTGQGWQRKGVQFTRLDGTISSDHA
jgi:hypothetical protein